jgi:hypothetical protein
MRTVNNLTESDIVRLAKALKKAGCKPTKDYTAAFGNGQEKHATSIAAVSAKADAVLANF